MARTPQQLPERLANRWIARAGTVVAFVVVLSLALPVLARLTPDGPLPSAVVSAADARVRLDKPGVPVRIEIPSAGIDLPVVSSARNVRGNSADYPLCDVAEYWTRYDLPGAPGTAWIYAHAQPGMFLPLFTISEATDGKGLLGKIIVVQLKDGRLLRYRINQVKERAYTQSIARGTRPGQQRLILHTSTGPPGTIPKLQVAARLIGARLTDEPAPKAKPRACSQPRPTRTPRKSGRKTPTPEPVEVIAPEEPVDAMTLALGSGVILLGVTVVAVYLVRREP